jgi:hypothetical protein
MLARAVGVVQHGACQLLQGKRRGTHPGACKLAKECVRTFGSAVAVLSVEVRGTVHRIGTGSEELRSAGEEVETHLCCVCASLLIFPTSCSMVDFFVNAALHRIRGAWRQTRNRARGQGSKGGRRLERYKIVLMRYCRKSYSSCQESHS